MKSVSERSCCGAARIERSVPLVDASLASDRAQSCSRPIRLRLVVAILYWSLALLAVAQQVDGEDVDVTATEFALIEGKLEEIVPADPVVVVPVSGDTSLLVSQAALYELMKESELKWHKELFRYIIAGALIVAASIVLIAIGRTLSSKDCYSARDVVNVTGIVMIIFAIVFLVVVADNKDQLTISIGVLGTIAGYLFGSFQRERRPSSAPLGDGEEGRESRGTRGRAARRRRA